MKNTNTSAENNLVDNRSKTKTDNSEFSLLASDANTCNFCNEYDGLNKLVANEKNELVINSYRELIHKNSNSILTRIASIPEMNPNPIIEIASTGVVTYQNPAYEKHFQSFTSIYETNGIFKDFIYTFHNLLSEKIKIYSKEILHNDICFLKKAIYIPKYKVVQIFFFDITEQYVHEKMVIERNKEITDSIQYAKRIQDSILPSENYFKLKFPHSFILYKPKDIVAGDFYWLNETDKFIFVAAADCTGHGVPGALVSIVCNNALNRSVNEFGITDTGKILYKTRELVLNTFANEANGVSDGMDIFVSSI